MRKMWRILLFLVLTFCLLAFLSLQLQTERGREISEQEFLTFDDVLYTPEQIDALSEAERAKGYVGWDYEYQRTWDEKPFARVRTNVLELELEPGEVYGIHCEEFTYAAKLYVDGRLLAQLGKVSLTPEGFVPRTGSVTVYFTAGETTQIVTQRCNFDHAKWNSFDFYLGPQDVITRQVQCDYFKNTAMLIFLLTIGILNIGMFAGLPSRREYLWLSLSAVSLLINAAFSNPKLIMLVFPEMNWYLGHRLESSAILFLALSLFLFARSCFRRPKQRWLTVTGLVCLALSLPVFWVFPASIYSKYNNLLILITGGLFILYYGYELIWGLIRWKTLKGYQKYVLIGLVIILLAAVCAVLNIGPSHLETIPISLILFELVLTLGLAIEFSDVQNAFAASRRNEAELRKMNEQMEQNQELQENFMAIMNHEMRTPLTVIAGYAELSVQQLEEEAKQDTEMIRSLQIIKQEALRLGRIVEQSDEGARTAISASELRQVPILSLLKGARDFCQPICEKRNNRIEIDCPAELAAWCMHDGMLQALYNLVINASRHTEHGCIRLTAGQDGEQVQLRVTDDGEGMDDETMRRAFDRGFSTDGGHGLGLSLCREILERQNGTIRIERNPDRGISVCMTLPRTQADVP